MNALNARHVLGAAIGLIGIVSIVHCSSSASPSANVPGMQQGDAGRPTTGTTDADGGGANPVFLDSSKGLILVHGSANLPAFRLCFGTLSPSGYLMGSSTSLRPLPDRELMPDANVVGVEIGSAVRLKPLQGDFAVDATAHAFAMPEKYIRPGGSTDLPCSARICPTGSSGTCLPKDPQVPGDRGFYDLGELPAGATQENVQLLTVHGCVAGSVDGGAGATSCGAGYDPLVGNVQLDLLPLTAYKTVTPSQFLVQVAQLSGSVVGTALGVSYGDLAGKKETIALSANFGQLAPAGSPQTFELDRTAPGIYGSRGFELTFGKQVFAKSLAEIQLVTAPQAVPDDLYSAKSNFVLLLLGDPALSDLSGNALSQTTEPGLLLHLLVVPVGQPVESDAGAGIADAGGG